MENILKYKKKIFIDTMNKHVCFYKSIIKLFLL